MQYSIGIVGAKGRMGSLFEQLFISQGVEVATYDLDSQQSLKEFVKKPDIIILSVPINVVCSVIDQIAPYVSENQLVTDITSIKQQPCFSLKQLESETLGLHPLFGPSISSPEGYPIAVCKIHGGTISTHFLALLEEIGFKLLHTTPEKHDKLMSYVQCLPHFLSMSFTRFLKESPFSEGEILEYSPPFFKLLFYSLIRIFSQSGSLYTDIQKNNLYFEDILLDFLKSIEKTKKQFLYSDESYQNLFDELQLFVRDELKDAKEYTDSFIQIMKNQ